LALREGEEVGGVRNHPLTIKKHNTYTLTGVEHYDTRKQELGARNSPLLVLLSFFLFFLFINEDISSIDGIS